MVPLEDEMRMSQDVAGAAEEWLDTTLCHALPIVFRVWCLVSRPGGLDVDASARFV